MWNNLVSESVENEAKDLCKQLTLLIQLYS